MATKHNEIVPRGTTEPTEPTETTETTAEIVPRGTMYRIAKGVSNVFIGGQVYHSGKDSNTKFAESEEVLDRLADGHLEIAE